MTQNSARIDGQTSNLGGDLSGTITNSTVVGIQNILIVSGTPNDGYILTYLSSNSKWQAESITAAANSNYTVGPLIQGITKITVNGSNVTYNVTASDTILYVHIASNNSSTINLPASVTTGRTIYLVYDDPGGGPFPTVNSSPGWISQTSTSSITGENMAMFISVDGTNWSYSWI